MRDRSFAIMIRLVLLLFIFISLFFLLSIKNQTYLGIRAKKNGNEWIIKKIQSGGVASQTQLKQGDLILHLDDQEPNDNSILTKWLIVEDITEIEVLRSGKNQTIIFPKKNNLLVKQLLFTLVAVICLSILFILPSLINSSTTYRLFFLFVTGLSFSAISVIPSSVGIDVARVIIISVVLFFPYFFLKFSDYGKNQIYGIKKIAKGVCLLGKGTFFMLLLNLCGLNNYWFSEYLSIGIFYVFGLLLAGIVISSLITIKASPERNLISQINLSLITSLSFAPLFFFYVFPIRYTAPFYLVILFTLLPLATITHLLFINRLIKQKKRMKIEFLALFVAMAVGVAIWLLVELGNYIPTTYLALFTAMLIYALLPLLSESLSLMYKERDGNIGVQLFVAVEEERENISTHIHDTIIQEIIYEMNRIEKKDILQASEVNIIFEEIIYGLRELCTEIYPLMIQELGIENTLKTTINSMQQKYPVTIMMTIDPKIEQLSLRIKNFLLRTIRESMTNSIKHGEATEISITLFFLEEVVTLTVFDNGRLKSQATTAEHHFGIHLISEKIKMLEGTVSLTRESNRTKFQLELPINLKKGSGGV